MSYSCIVIRKHLLLDKQYTLSINQDKIFIGQDVIIQIQQKNQPKYVFDISLTNKICWKIGNDGNLQGFAIKHLNKLKWFHSQTTKLVELRALLKNSIYFNSISSFFSSHEVLGSGASCKVFLIQDNFTKIRYAAKCISKEYITKKNTPDRLNRLQNEIRILKILKNCQNVVELSEIFEGESSYYLIFELLSGQTLHKFIKNVHKQLPEDTIRVILNQLLIALKGIHSLNFLHRDIKLENVVFARPNDITSLKLIDFGLAISLDEYTPYSVCGTPGYIAPEVLQHEELSKKNIKFTYSTKIDNFGIGVMLYRLMTRQPLFESDKTKELLSLNKRCNVQKLFIQDYSVELNEVLYGLLDSDPKNRLSAEQALQVLNEQKTINNINNNNIRGISITTTKSQDHKEIVDDFEVEQTKDFANMPYQFPSKLIKMGFESSFHQNDDYFKKHIEQYHPSFSMQPSMEIIQEQKQMQDFVIEK